MAVPAAWRCWWGDRLVDFRFRIDAEDADGVIVYTLPFKHAVNIIPDKVDCQ